MIEYDFEKLRSALPLPELMQRLGLGEHAKKAAFCPFHENTATPSFSVYQKESGRVYWKCHSTCGGGDEVDLLEKHLGLSKPEALKRWAELAGGAVHSKPVSSCRVQRAPAPAPALTREPVVMPSDLHDGTRDELETVARLRGVDFWAVATMKQNEVIKFGSVCGFACWIVTDCSRSVAEARRLDGKLFPAIPDTALGERKVHTLKGSNKSSPVGLQLPSNLTTAFQRFLLLEGSGDFVAGYHFAMRGSQSWLPVAMLGASNHLSPDACRILNGKQVLVIPHVDENNAGANGAGKWAAQLMAAGCEVRGLSLGRFRKPDGKPVKDLNDCVQLSQADLEKLEGVFV